MSEKICVVGESGTGKSTAIHQNEDLGIKGLDPKKTVIINVAGKGLPFKGWKKYYTPFEGKKGNYLTTNNPAHIVKALDIISKERKEVTSVVIDDYQYLLAFEFINKALRKDWDKWSEMAKHAMDVVFAADKIKEDVDIFFLTHSENVQSMSGVEKKIKTIGKLIDEKITLEGLFTVLLYSGARWDGKEKAMEYFFVTNKTEDYPAKTPYKMFPSTEIRNDLGLVKELVHGYYEE